MLKKNIAKISVFVISLILISSCSMIFPGADQFRNSGENFSDKYEKPQIVGKVESKEIDESSGFAASRCNTNVFWTHNDSGDDAFIYALNEKGEKLGTWRVSGATNFDWEDMATRQEKSGACFLYIGEIGNNALKRNEFTIYRVKEPQVSNANKSSSRKNPETTETAEAIKFSYPDSTHNAETLMIQPESGDIYILTKQSSDAAGVYKLKSGYSLEKTNKLEKIADFTVPSVPNGLLTGGDISPDGKRVIVCDYFNAYEIILPEKAKNFDEIWAQKTETVELGKREVGEAVGYAADGSSIFATSEKNDSPFIQVKRKPH